jgi:hypothetical protein
MQKESHTHDVQVFWESWPWNPMLPRIVRDFLTGYGINPWMTHNYDLTVWTRFWWNLFWSFFGLNPWNWFWGIIWFIPDQLYYWFFEVWFDMFYQIPVYITRWFWSVPQTETAIWKPLFYIM